MVSKICCFLHENYILPGKVRRHLFEELNPIFQQDNATPHIVALRTKFFRNSQVISFPGQLALTGFIRNFRRLRHEVQIETQFLKKYLSPYSFDVLNFFIYQK